MSRISKGDLVISSDPDDNMIGTVIALPPEGGMWSLVRIKSVKGGPTYRYDHELMVLWSPRKILEFIE